MQERIIREIDGWPAEKIEPCGCTYVNESGWNTKISGWNTKIRWPDGHYEWATMWRMTTSCPQHSYFPEDE